MTEDEMVGWDHRFNGHEFEQALGDSEGQESLACCSPWGCKESDTTEWLNTRREREKTRVGWGRSQPSRALMDVKAEATGFSVEECSRLRAQQVQEPGGGQTWWLSGRNCLVIPAPEGGVAPEDREVPNHHRLREISLDFILKGMEGLLGVVQWLRPCVSTTGGIGLIRGQGTKIP